MSEAMSNGCEGFDKLRRLGKYLQCYGIATSLTVHAMENADFLRAEVRTRREVQRQIYDLCVYGASCLLAGFWKYSVHVSLDSDGKGFFYKLKPQICTISGG